MPPVVVVGDGAVGTAVAVALSCSGRSVVLAGPEGTPETGVVFSTHGYTDESAELVYTAVDRVRTDSIVVAALKAFAIREAVPDIEKTGCREVICLSNGMGLEEEWGVLSERVEYAVLTMGFRKSTKVSVATTEGTVYCRKGGTAADMFSLSGIPVEEVENMNTVRWAKWYANSIINPIGALSGLANNRILKAGLQPLVTALSREVSMLMPEEGAIDQGQRLLEWLLENSENKCSMLQDIERGRKTEMSFLTGLCTKKLQSTCPTASVLVSLIRSREHAVR
jgi:2-dehydropantoate 2-reductase